MDMLREKLSITKAELDTAVKHLEKKYSGDCGIRLLTFNHKLQMATNPDYKDPVAIRAQSHSGKGIYQNHPRMRGDYRL